MSRRRSISTAMGPPPDRDIIMGPPPPPLPSAQQPIQQTSKDNQEITEKYRKLKRRYFELEDKYKETQAELHRSGERNVKMREERELILSRIHELETHSEPNALGVPCPPSSAFPRALLSSRAQSAFVANLRQAMIEDETDDHDADPLLTSRHIGPLARKRAEDEHRERVEEEARENRRAARRPRGGPAKGKEAVGQHTPPGQPLMTYAPSAPHQSGPNAPPPVLVSKQGTRLRIKPPVPPSSAEPGPSAHPSNSQSSLSPLLSPQEEHYDPVHHSANGNHHQQSEFTPPQPGPSPSLPPQTSPVASASTSRQSAKPKRLKAHTVTQKNYSIPTVPRDKKGRPLLPLNVGIMTVVNLGEVCMREHFHTERYIFPVGYEVTRRYLSTIDATAEVVYHCSIVDGGDGPKFQIVASDVPDRPIIAGTATGAWSTIVKQANSIRNRQHSNSVSGPDFFGLGQNTIKHLIQELPGANRLRDYVWQIFVEGGPLGGRHAAVIPALPEEHDSNTPNADGFVEDALSPSLNSTLTPSLIPTQAPIPHLPPQPFNTIILPSPTPADTLNIHEYRPPLPKDADSRRQQAHNPRGNGNSNSNTPSDSASATAPQVSPPPPTPQSHSPYISKASSSAPPGAPTVPPTFASIMNAYPAPPQIREDSRSQSQSRPGSQESIVNGGGSTPRA